VVVSTVDDSIVLDCYRLASHYKIDPRVFLDMPMSEVQLHMARTAQLESSRQQSDE
jgi:hypothetical protein